MTTAPPAGDRVREQIEVFRCRRIAGWAALLWFRRGSRRLVYRAVFAPTATAALAAAEVWAERLPAAAREEL